MCPPNFENPANPLICLVRGGNNIGRMTMIVAVIGGGLPDPKTGLCELFICSIIYSCLVPWGDLRVSIVLVKLRR